MGKRLVLCALLLASAAAVGCKGSKGGASSGSQIFTANCARCHGMNGVPDPGTRARTGVRDLTDPALQARLSDAEIKDQIVNGSANRQMPAFGKVFTPQQISALVVHVRSLRDDKTALP